MKPFLPVFVSLLLAVSAQAQETPAADAAAAAAANKSIIAKLNTIIIPRIQFREATIAEGMAYFQQKGVELDPDPDPAKRGVNLIYKPDASLPPEAKVTMSLSNMPLGDALHYFALLGRLKVTFDAGGIVFEPIPANAIMQDDPLDPKLGGDTKAILARLNKIIIPRIEFREATLHDGLSFLIQKAMQIDPDAAATGVGSISFVINPGRAPTPTTATPAPGGRPGIASAPAVDALPEPKITLSLSNIPLSDALHYIAILAGMKVTVDPCALVFEPLPAGVDPAKEPALQPQGDAAMAARLDAIILPKLEIRDAHIPDLVSFLRSKSVELYPAKTGVTIIVIPDPPGTTRNAAPPTLSLSLANKSLGDVLHTIATDGGYKLIIDPRAVVLDPEPKAK